jgi:hypothetical protein
MASIIKADTLQSTTSNVFVLNSAGTEYARFHTTDGITFSNGGAERVRITNDGNVGIGTTGPSNFGGTNLQVANTNIASVVWTNGTYTGQLLASAASEVTVGSRSNHVLRFATNDTERARIDTSGNFKLSSAGTKVLNSSGNPILQQTGSVLQVVNGTTTSTTSTTSNSFVDTNLTATITPTSSTSKIFVIVSTIIYFTRGSASGGGKLQLVRGATNLITQTDSSLFMTAASVASIESIVQPSVTYLDSPATTSATTYKMQVAANGGTTIYFSWNNNASFLTLMEISA